MFVRYSCAAAGRAPVGGSSQSDRIVFTISWSSFPFMPQDTFLGELRSKTVSRQYRQSSSKVRSYFVTS